MGVAQNSYNNNAGKLELPGATQPALGERVMPGIHSSLIDRFWKKINKNGLVPIHKPELGPCWIWTAFIDAAGYGRIHGTGRDSSVLFAHVISYELVNGKVPSNLELDHLCQVRKCCNPNHLEAVTHQINAIRGKGLTMHLHRSGFCKRGHLQGPGKTCYRRWTRKVVYCHACRRGDRRESKS